MGDVSASRKYPSNVHNPAKLLNVVQHESINYCGNSSELEVTGEFGYEDGISEKRELSIYEIYDVSIVDHLEYLYFYTEIFQVFIYRYETEDRVAVFSDSREIVLSIFNHIEQELSKNDETNCENGTDNGPITDDLIQKLARDGKKLVENAVEQNCRDVMKEEACLEIDVNTIWEKTISYIKERISRPSFDTWIASLKPVFIDNENKRIVVRAANDFARDWVEARYGLLFTEALDFVEQGEKYHIYFIANGNSEIDDTKSTPQQISGEEVLRLMHYFLLASRRVTCLDALMPVEASVLEKVFINAPKAIGIGCAEANLYQAAQQALHHRLFKNNMQQKMDFFIFIACNQSIMQDDLNSAILNLKSEIRIDGTLVFGAYVDKSLEGKVTVGILGIDSAI